MFGTKDHWAAALCFVVLSLAASVVSAQADGVTARARALFDRGVTHFQVGDYEAALVEFEEAYRLKPHPAVRVNIANCFDKLGKPVEALYHYETFLRESDSSLSTVQREEVQRAIEALRGQIGDLWLVVEPAGASIKIDNEAPGVAPLSESVRLSAGRHRVEVSMDGYSPERRDISIEAQKHLELTISLRRSSTPGTEGSSAMGTTSATSRNTDETRMSESVSPESERRVKLKRRITTPMFVAGGISIALLIAGIGTGVSALAANNDFDDAVSRANNPGLSAATRARAREDGHAAADRANNLALASDILFGGALVGTGVTLLLYFTQKTKRMEDDPEESARVSASPQVTSNSAGVSLNGKF